MARNTVDFKVYKGMGGKGYGAAQFSLSPARQEGEATEAGAVFMDITSPSAPNVYDWNQKIKMALGITDLGQILHFLRYGTNQKGEDLSIFHDPGAKSETAGQTGKSFVMSSPGGIKEGFMLTVSQKTGDKTVTHRVPFNGAEAATLSQLVQAAISRVLGWT